MVEKGIRGGICHAIHRCAKANNKYMKNYDENEESSFDLMDDLSKIGEDFIKNYDKDSDKEYILEVDVEYPKNLSDLHSNLPFLPERMKTDKCSKLVCNLFDKKTYKIIKTSFKSWVNIKESS